jgi:hypothetical protein
MRQFLYVLSLAILMLHNSCDNNQPAQAAPTNTWGCTMREVEDDIYSVEFDCPPGVWEQSMAMHRIFHPPELFIVEP